MRASLSACISSLAAIALVVVVGGCASVVPVPSIEDAQWASQGWAGTTTAQLNQGRSLYVANCGGCHSLYPTSHLPPHAWPARVDEMVERAGLGLRERDSIVRYLQTASRNVAKSNGRLGPTASVR